MEDDDKTGTNSVVEINIGQHRVRVESSEEFISEELESILRWTSEAIESAELDSPKFGSEGSIEDDPKQTSLVDVGPTASDNSDQDGIDSEPKTEESTEGHTESGQIDEIARRLSANPENLKSHFYLDENTTHVQDPLHIDPKYAFLGYCLIEKERTGESYRDNRETKQALIDQEMIDIESWGSNFLYRLRQEGLIKDNPNSDRSRNKPFKITPKGHREFVNWLQEN